MEKVIVAEANTSPSSSEPRIICRVCQKQFSQYTCPQCNSRYCSLQCYKRHSLRCTESFMRENVMEELKQVQPDDETKRKMVDILKRFHSEEEMNSEDDGGETMLSEEIIQKVLSGEEIKLEDLSPEEIKHFRRTIASGELSKLIEPWTPWWRKPSARSISLSPEGCQLVKPLDVQSSTVTISEIPVGPESPLQPLKQLMHGEPSPLLTVHVIDVLYSYCFTLRLYNGDWYSDPLSASTMAFSMSKVLGDVGRPETVTEALAACIEETCSPIYKQAGGFSFAIGLIDDVICLLSLGTHALICCLCDFQRLFQAGERMLKSENINKTERNKTTQKLRSAERKVYFLMCWVHEQPAETWSTLADFVKVEKASLSQLDLGGESLKAETKRMSKPNALIHEV
ncbi:zinc finger HIT domain-containing protein 2-like isoform X1 [Zingiber officinale]|uniref:zinc finger HIT domain-containing protein 2-like isoform X1 n=1 Tax=Zingiber officinale TaxID=94328 RepID=UPI001C4C0B83|nr:zinc finger HIT domain-containing protein 2-like isoform X1 [Zingiber officinale]